MFDFENFAFTDFCRDFIDALKQFAIWLFGSDKRAPLFTDSRDVDTFGHVLESTEAIQYLETSDSPNFEVAVRISGGDESETIEIGRAHV